MKTGNPAVVGLAAFGLTTHLLQLHNLGFLGWGPVLSMGLVFGGVAQMIAGFQEQKMGNNFGYCAFVAYGAFWIGLSLIQLFNHLGFHASGHHDVGFYLVVWTLFTVILFIASLRIHTAMAFTFGTLVIGFVLLDLVHFGFPGLKKLAAIDLIVCALGAWYMMAGILLNDLAGKTVLPMGRKPIA